MARSGCVALTEKDKENGKHQQLKQISLEDGIPQTVYLQRYGFQSTGYEKNIQKRKW
nr:hypothetical protein [Piscirickettsia salmonis]